MYIFHIESRQIERIGHFSISINTLLTNDGCFHTGSCATIGRDTVLGERSRERIGETELQRLFLVVEEAVFGCFFSALFAVEQIGRLEPYVAQMIDEKLIIGSVFVYEQMAFVTGTSQTDKRYAGFFQYLFDFVGFFYLNQDTRIFAEQYLNKVFFGDFVQRNFQTAFGIGKIHFEHRGYHTAGGDIVPCQNQLFVNQFLDGIECVGKVFAVLYSGNFFTYFVERLGERRAS